MRVLEKRYAEAFYKLAAEKNAVPQYGRELAGVSEVYGLEKAFSDFLVNPRYAVLTKKQAVTNIFKSKISENTLNFILLLLDKGRIRHLPGIYLEYKSLADKQNNILKITIKTAVPLEPAYMTKICEKFKSMYHAAGIEAAVETDPTLIGSLVVAVEDKQFDGSVKGLLSRLQSELAS